MRDALKYGTQFDDRPGSTHNLVVGLIPPSSRVLEVGSATGYMSRVLRDRLDCTVTGIEISSAAADISREHLDQVIVGDAECLDLDEALGNVRFDAIVFADVLEHLRDPRRMLERIRSFLTDAGVIVASIPNVAHGSIRLSLLAGEFRYRPVGLLDETHLRFFTRQSIQDLFESSGYTISVWERRRLPIDESEIHPPATVSDEMIDLLARDEEATTYQFVVRAERSDDAGPLRRRILELEREREELQPRLAQAERDVQEARDQAGTLQAELDHARRDLAEARDALAQALQPRSRAKLWPLRRRPS